MFDLYMNDFVKSALTCFSNEFCKLWEKAELVVAASKFLRIYEYFL